MFPKIDKEEFIRRSKSIHGDRYDYSKVEYTNLKTLVTVICPVHGDFSVNPRSHYRGHRCSKCVFASTAISCAYTKEEVISNCILIWGNRFDYSDMKYSGRIHDQVNIKCNMCGSTFNQSMHLHMYKKQNGCVICQPRRGWRRSQWIKFCSDQNRAKSMVYIVRIFNDSESFIKIGMTSQTIFERFKNHKMPYEYEVIKEIKGSPLFVYNKELELHREFVKYKYKPIIKFEGSCECFSLDILPLVKDL